MYRRYCMSIKSELIKQASIINMQEHLSADDYKILNRLNNEIQNAPNGTVAVKVYAPERKYSFYLFDDPILCCGTEPYYFENEVEALLALDKAEMDYKLDYEFIYLYENNSR